MSKKKDEKNWFLLLVVAGLAYLAWSIYQLINSMSIVCTPVQTIIKPTLALLCNTNNTFFIPFGIAIGLIMIIVGIYNYSKKN
jgi:disulfide bond formation protein DsbB